MVAARTARAGSSSCATGTPKAAITASPMNFSTVPPSASISSRIAAKNVSMTSRSCSGSSCSPNAVDPVTSANRTVTRRRSCPLGAAGSPTASLTASPQVGQNRASPGTSPPQWGHAVVSEAPQLAQNRASSAFADPQLGQVTMRASVCAPAHPGELS